jgi:hypothetical protein
MELNEEKKPSEQPDERFAFKAISRDIKKVRRKRGERDEGVKRRKDNFLMKIIVNFSIH